MPTSLSADDFYNETMAKIFLQYYENTTRVVWNRFMEASWNYVTNINQQNLEEMVWYHLRCSPFPPCSSQGSRGDGGTTPSVVCPQLEERGKPQSTCQSRLQALGFLVALNALWARIFYFFPLVNITSLLLGNQGPSFLPLSKSSVILNA